MRTWIPFSVAALVLVGCTAGTDASGQAPTEAAPAEAIAISVADFMIEPDDVSAAGPTVTFQVTNDGPTPHNLTIRDEADEVLAATADLNSGESETLEAELEPGSYTIFCSLAGHESLGMSGTLTVTGGP